jgi:hypothetical protein
MILETANKVIADCVSKMNERFGDTVFDEWSIILFDSRIRVLSYHGPRKEHFLKNFSGDCNGLRLALIDHDQQSGDFQFAQHAGETAFDVFMLIGDGLCLICNNTVKSLSAFIDQPRWVPARAAFAELGEKFQSSPLVYPT